MAKKIQLSRPGTGIYFSLPTNEGSMTATKNSVEDSLLGTTFASTFPTLTDWEISTPGLYKGFSAYCGKVVKTGISTAVVGGAMSLLTGTTYQVDAVTNQIWDYTVTPVVFDDGIDVTNQVEEFDYLFGTVTFLGTYTVVGAITADFNFLPTSTFGRPTSFNLTQSVTAVDDSDYDSVCANGGFRLNKQGLREVSLTFDGIFDASEDFFAQLAANAEFILEIDPIGDGKSIARGYFRVTENGLSGAVGDNEAESVTFSLTVPSPDFRPFGWQHALDTNLNEAIRIALDGFDNEEYVDARYLPSGELGTDGQEGNMVVTDMSLESSIEDINRFSIGLMGNGAFTSV